MKYFTLFILITALTSPVFSEIQIDAFDSLRSDGYYTTISGSDGNTLAISVSSDTIYEGDGAFRLDWRVQANSFSGTWTRMQFWHPGDGVWDLSPGSEVSFNYYNVLPSSQAGLVKLQIYFFDVSHAPSNANSVEDVEVWLLDFEILDDSTQGWQQATVPLLQSDVGALEGDNWVKSGLGIDGNNRLDLHKIKGYAFQFTGSPSLLNREGKSASGELFVDNFQVIGESGGDPEAAAHIVVLGSSTAEGAGPLDRANAWVNRYRASLKEKNVYHRVDNLARGGYTTFHILPSGYGSVADRPAVDPVRNITKALTFFPDAIIINLPSNDATNGYTVTEQLANYDAVMTSANAAGVPVWVTTTQPRNLDSTGRQNLMDVRDSTFSRFGERAIDFWSDIALSDGTINLAYNSGDNIHINDAGHEIFFNRVSAKNIPGALLTDVPSYGLTLKSFKLHQNYPNPFNPTTTIEIDLTQGRFVDLAVFNMSGQKVAHLQNGFLPTGLSRFLFDATGLPSGVYVYRLTAGDKSLANKMLFVK